MGKSNSLTGEELKPTEGVRNIAEACNAWLVEGRVIFHEAFTEDGDSYVCAHCGCKLKHPATTLTRSENV